MKELSSTAESLAKLILLAVCSGVAKKARSEAVRLLTASDGTGDRRVFIPLAFCSLFPPVRNYLHSRCLI
jgi:hypothetical protein